MGFERKVRLSTWALLFERIWPRAWCRARRCGPVRCWSRWLACGRLLGRYGAQAACWPCSLWRWWPRLWRSRPAYGCPRARRRSAGSSAAPACRTGPPRPTRTQLSHPGIDPATTALWQAHRARIARMLERLKVGAPRPRTDRHDPLALRAAMLLGVALADRIRRRISLGPAGLRIPFRPADHRRRGPARCLDHAAAPIPRSRRSCCRTAPAAAC